MPDERLIRYDVADPQAGGQRRPFARAVRAGDFQRADLARQHLTTEFTEGTEMTMKRREKD